MTWLQGGPFLEVSFLLSFERDYYKFISYLFSHLKSLKTRIEFACSEEELLDQVTQFANGYVDDESDPLSITYHQAQIQLYINTDSLRKSVLAINTVSEDTIEVNFWFYGDTEDVTEWDQRGVKENEMYIFKNFLLELFDEFNFLIGSVGYENSVIGIIGGNQGWPDEVYSLDNLQLSPFDERDLFEFIVANANFFKSIYPGFKKEDNRLIFERVE